MYNFSFDDVVTYAVLPTVPPFLCSTEPADSSFDGFDGFRRAFALGKSGPSTIQKLPVSTALMCALAAMLPVTCAPVVGHGGGSRAETAGR